MRWCARACNSAVAATVLKTANRTATCKVTVAPSVKMELIGGKLFWKFGSMCSRRVSRCAENQVPIRGTKSQGVSVPAETGFNSPAMALLYIVIMYPVLFFSDIYYAPGFVHVSLKLRGSMNHLFGWPTRVSQCIHSGNAYAGDTRTQRAGTCVG